MCAHVFSSWISGTLEEFILAARARSKLLADGDETGLEPANKQEIEKVTHCASSDYNINIFNSSTLQFHFKSAFARHRESEKFK